MRKYHWTLTEAGWGVQEGFKLEYVWTGLRLAVDGKWHEQ